METMLPLPINNLVSSPAGAGQPPPEPTEGGGFLQVLAQYFEEKADSKKAPEDTGLENPDSSALGDLLAAFAVGNPSLVSPEMRTSWGNRLSGSEEESAPMATPLLEVY